MSTFQVLTVLAAWAGLALGGVNLFREIRKNRVVLAVEHDLGEKSGRPQITVRNKSLFAVVVDEVGFCVIDGNRWPLLSARNPILDPLLPQKLEARQSFAWKIDIREAALAEMKKFNGVYAVTQCGYTKQAKLEKSKT